MWWSCLNARERQQRAPCSNKNRQASVYSRGNFLGTSRVRVAASAPRRGLRAAPLALHGYLRGPTGGHGRGRPLSRRAPSAFHHPAPSPASSLLYRSCTMPPAYLEAISPPRMSPRASAGSHLDDHSNRELDIRNPSAPAYQVLGDRAERLNFPRCYGPLFELLSLARARNVLDARALVAGILKPPFRHTGTRTHRLFGPGR